MDLGCLVWIAGAYGLDMLAQKNWIGAGICASLIAIFVICDTITKVKGVASDDDE